MAAEEEEGRKGTAAAEREDTAKTPISKDSGEGQGTKRKEP